MNMKRRAIRIRSLALVSIHAAGSGHPGGCLSAADLLAYLIFEELRWPTMNPDKPDRNRFVLSKGHACPALYAAAAEAGRIPHAMLHSLRKRGSALQGHPDVLATPWVETSTGSLGQGFSAAVGMSMGLRHRGIAARVYVMLGDGELQEGQVWESAMSAGHYGLDNLCGIIDYNKMQSDDRNENVISLEPLGAKWEAFNWHVVEINGHDFDEIGSAFAEAKSTKGKPTAIVAHTIKGKGVSFMEGSPLWHGSVVLSDDDLRLALRDLGTVNEYRRECNATVWKARGA